MDLLSLLQAAILGLVEGITEFIPVSSTGHLIVAGDLLGFMGERAKTFEIFIQLGAILAVVWLYRQRFLLVARSLGQSPKSRVFVVNLALGFLPAAVIGLVAHRWIKARKGDVLFQRYKMTSMRKKTWLSWSSGKDSAWALQGAAPVGWIRGHGVVHDDQHGVRPRVAMHAVRVDLLREQARAVGLPLYLIEIPYPCSDEQYAAAMADFVASARRWGGVHGVRRSVSGGCAPLPRGRERCGLYLL